MQRIKNTISAFLVIAVLVVVLAIQTTGKAKADTYTWIDAPQLYLTKVGDVTAADIPTTVWGDGNIDCTQDGSNCAVPTLYGYGSPGNSAVKFTNDSQYYPVADYSGSYNHFWSIPNSNAALTTYPSSGVGNYVWFYNDFPNSVDFISGSPAHYKINHTYDSALADKSGNLQIVDFDSLGFSSDSSWMIGVRPNTADLAVNTSTHDVLPFAGSITYGLGNNPKYVQAITDDGNYAVVAQKNYTSFNIYDLSTCGTVPNTINGPVSCQYRDLNTQNGFISQQIPGYIGTWYMRFTDNSSVDFYVKYSDSGTIKYAEYTLSDN